jgi:hypothetical protein
MSLQSWWHALSTHFKADLEHFEDDTKSPLLYLAEGDELEEKIEKAIRLNIPVVSLEAIQTALKNNEQDDSIYTAEDGESSYKLGILTISNSEVNPYKIAYYMVESLFIAGHTKVLIAAPHFSQADRDALGPIEDDF